ncbi:MAG: hypothetical protein JSW43_02660 [Gemmatimonadota bacterium]|nr:MAG: hypothetical protein JSW43_02660 [Gemmatimonadota bacterium]
MDLDAAITTTPVSEAKPPRITLGELFWGLLGFFAKVVLLIVLPFVVLLRTAVYLYLQHDVSTWLALGGGAALALLVLTAYGAWISKKVTGKGRVGFVAKWVALPLVLFYCGYALLHLASVNAKTEEVRSYYTALHPLLRLSVSTFTLLDGDLVITDLTRTPQDYISMGLPVYEASLHYPQDDGYAHAMDLRTLDRAFWRNWFMEGYFRVMGLRTLRHVGTADHLHVSLPPQ